MKARYTVLYDDQCEICQAGVSWLRVLDRKQQVDCVPIDPQRLTQLHPALTIDECLRQLHVVSADGRIHVGWDALTALARLFPLTWLIAVVGRVEPFRWLGRKLYRWVATNRYVLSRCRGGSCRRLHVTT